MKRVTVFCNGRRTEGRLVCVGDSIEELIEQCGRKLGLNDVRTLYTAKGAVVDDTNLLRDDEVLYVSCGEPFRPHEGTPVQLLANGTSMVTASRLSNGSALSEEIERLELDLPAGADSHTDWIVLNVGGQMFTTTRSTLVGKEPDTMLARMFSCNREGNGCWNNNTDTTGAILIDRSPKYFEPILNYLRHGELILDRGVNPRGVLEEAKFFGMQALVEILESKVLTEEPPTDATPLSRRDLVLKLIGTPTELELRCQGVNFAGANLSKLDLRHINFKYAVLRGANLKGANLSHCNFERADLSSARLDGAHLLGVKMLCVNLELASMQGCNFEDPAGSRANMEGANMKQVNLEGSHMAGVNLRVATLKNSNLQNCDLRGAVLAGADLENCDLSGCDLQEANLRGANLKGAAFELMLNPLHMSQTVR